MFTMTSSNTTQIASAPGSLSKWAGEYSIIIIFFRGLDCKRLRIKVWVFSIFQLKPLCVFFFGVDSVSCPSGYISGLAQRHLVDAFSLPLLCPKFCHQLMEEVKHFRKSKEDTGDISPGKLGINPKYEELTHTHKCCRALCIWGETHSLISLGAAFFSVSPCSSQGTSVVCWNQMTRQAFSWVPDGTFTRSTLASRFSSTSYFKMLVFQKQVILLNSNLWELFSEAFRDYVVASNASFLWRYRI